EEGDRSEKAPAAFVVGTASERVRVAACRAEGRERRWGRIRVRGTGDVAFEGERDGLAPGTVRLHARAAGAGAVRPRVEVSVKGEEAGKDRIIFERLPCDDRRLADGERGDRRCGHRSSRAVGGARDEGGQVGRA